MKIKNITVISIVIILLESSLTSGRKRMLGSFVEKCIKKELTKRFEPKVLEVTNEYEKFDVSKEDESHFKIVIVSDVFEGMPLLERHKLINETLSIELEQCVKYLDIVSKSPSEWKK